MWFLAVVCLVLAVVLGVLAYTAYSLRHSRVVIDDHSVKLVGDLWGRTIPLARLNVADARIVDLARTPELTPRRRTMGTGLPGYASGWFRLRNGEKALVYLTDQRRVAYVPTDDQYALLLSVENPSEFIAALRRRVSATPR